MEKKISNAFTYMFKDSDWMFKFAILAGLGFPSIYLSYFAEQNKLNPTLTQLTTLVGIAIITLITSPIICGYLVKCAQNIIFAKSPNPNILPVWEDNFLNYFIIGIKYAIAVLLIGIVIIPGILLIIPFLMYLFLSLALSRVFCTELKISSYFAWKTAMDLIKQDTGKYIRILLTQFVVALIYSLSINLLTKSLIGMIIALFFFTYFVFISAYFIGIIGSEEATVIEE